MVLHNDAIFQNRKHAAYLLGERLMEHSNTDASPAKPFCQTRTGLRDRWAFQAFYVRLRLVTAIWKVEGLKHGVVRLQHSAGIGSWQDILARPRKH